MLCRAALLDIIQRSADNAVEPELTADFAANRIQRTVRLKKSSGWSIGSWLSSLNLHHVVAEALSPPPNEDAFTFVRQALTPEVIQARLTAAGLAALVPFVRVGVERLREQQASTGAALSAKFQQEAGAFQLHYASLNTFFGGLEAKIGPPDPNIGDAMAREHTSAADSNEVFTSSNYRLTTTPAVEWQFVVAPESRAAWPAESQDMIAPEHMRSPLPEEGLRRRLRDFNSRLNAMEEPLLLVEEAYASRLYTGPMFVKYNDLLRGFGAALAGCKGNMYVTTTHVINSAIVKASKLTRVAKVYRGMAGGVLPPSFWRANEQGVKGGIEAAFMST